MSDVGTADLSIKWITIHFLLQSNKFNLNKYFKYGKICMSTTFIFELLAVLDSETQHCQGNNANNYNDH